MVAMSAVVPVSEDAAGQVAVLVGVSVMAVLAAVSVAVVHGSAPAERQSRTSPAASDGCPLRKRLGTFAEAEVVPWAVQVAVLAPVSVTAVLAVVSVAAVLAAVHGSAPAEGHSRTSPAASDGCPLGKKLGTVVEAVDVSGAVHVAVVVAKLAVFAAVQVGVVVDRKCDTGPSVGATMPSPALLFSFWPFPSFDGSAVVLPLSPLVFAEPLVLSASTSGMWAPFSPWQVAECPCPRNVAHWQPRWMALHDPAVAGTTVPGDVVAEVLVWELESLALGEGLGVRCREEVNVSQEEVLDTLGGEDGGGLGVEVVVVVVGGVRLLNLREGAWARGCCGDRWLLGGCVPAFVYFGRRAH
ncbi:hypothetical protein NDU88_003949 [Pleurodeles waltl]|uniref:Uncharacterized protein n=1 Tax=Pleurodeles waltl TaxID=8319 RepID=A0AAV7VFN6_PLEWA|nr:hypothetical protein NDU88_003949 [Pleurodeles waltl]